jgi:hypothetical protein
MRLAYGLAISASLITGGVAIYYAAGPRSTMTAPDIVELKEGINERAAAIGTWPFTGNSTDGWSFTEYSTQSMILTHADMKSIMDWQRDHATNFVKEYSGTNITYWTAAGLFQAAVVGPADGTSTLYTVGVRTNGTRIYSNAPIATVWTGLLWECYRLQCLMTTTVRTLSTIVTNTFYAGTNRWDVDLWETINSVYTNPTPVDTWNPQGIPPDGPNINADIVATNRYSLLDTIPLLEENPANQGYPVSYEAFESFPETMSYGYWHSSNPWYPDYLIYDYDEVSLNSGNRERMRAYRNWVIYKLPFAEFPDGVSAAVQCVSLYRVQWRALGRNDAAEWQPVDLTIDTSTNFVAQDWQIITFTNIISTSVYSMITVTSTPSITNAYMDQTLPTVLYGEFTDYTLSATSGTWSGNGNIIFTQTNLFDGSIQMATNYPKAIINWTFTRCTNWPSH